MARVVDWEAVGRDLEHWLIDERAINGRTSHGTDHLLARLAELRREHSIEESDDRAVLRRFAGHLTDSFFSLVPAGVPAPLADDDRKDVAGDGPAPGPTDDRGGHDGSEDHAARPEAAAHA